MIRFIITSITIIFLFSLVSCNSDEGAKPDETNIETVAVATTPAVPLVDQTIIYYLHSTRRCATCEKLEALAEEAIKTGFAKELEEGTIAWQVINFEEEGNEHFAQKYELFTQSLIISQIEGGEETQWKNLDSIWKLVGEKEEYISYVQREISEFTGETGQ